MDKVRAMFVEVCVKEGYWSSVSGGIVCDVILTGNMVEAAFEGDLLCSFLYFSYPVPQKHI